MTFDKTNAFISDFNSTHGTFLIRRGSTAVARLAVGDLTQLEEGDVVRFGESSRRYVFHVTPDDETEVKISVRIPATSVGRLIGRGGATIQALQERTRAIVDLVGNDDVGNFREVKIAGAPQAVATARLELLAITAGDPPPTVPTTTAAAPSGRFRYASTVVKPRGDDDDPW